MGTWGTFVVAEGRPAGVEVVDEVGLRGGWHRFFVSDLLTPDPAQIAGMIGTAPAIFGTVADSDYCRVVGVTEGQIRWGWSFGEAPWDPAPPSGESADPSDITSEASQTSGWISEWAEQASLRTVEPSAVAEVLDQGYVFAEEGLFALLVALGLAAAAPDDRVSAIVNAPIERPIHIWNSPNRWVSLQFNTTADLYDHLDAVASWLEEARRRVLVPLVASFDEDLVRTTIDPHESVRGAPGGLLVRSGGWSVKDRPVFGGADEAGWSRKLRQLSRKELREVGLSATAFGPSGHWRDGPGEAEVAAVVRDQFVQKSSAPLPRDHPGQLKVWARTKLLDRLPELDAESVLIQLGQLAVDTIPDGHSFLELERPLAGSQEVVPVSPLTWTSHPESVTFRPESVHLEDPPRRAR